MLDENKLFDFIKIMFTKQDKFNQLSNYVKKKHHFMVNRFFSIKYPKQAALMNKVGINGAYVTDFWSQIAKRYKAVPGWIFTKTKKDKRHAKDVTDKYSAQVIHKFKEIHRIGPKEFNELANLNPDGLESELEKIKTQM